MYIGYCKSTVELSFETAREWKILGKISLAGWYTIERKESSRMIAEGHIVLPSQMVDESKSLPEALFFAKTKDMCAWQGDGGGRGANIQIFQFHTPSSFSPCFLICFKEARSMHIGGVGWPRFILLLLLLCRLLLIVSSPQLGILVNYNFPEFIVESDSVWQFVEMHFIASLYSISAAVVIVHSRVSQRLNSTFQVVKFLFRHSMQYGFSLLIRSIFRNFLHYGTFASSVNPELNTDFVHLSGIHFSFDMWIKLIPCHRLLTNMILVVVLPNFLQFNSTRGRANDFAWMRNVSLLTNPCKHIHAHIIYCHFTHWHLCLLFHRFISKSLPPTNNI